MRYIKVFAPGTVANLGCGFDVMGLTLDGVGDCWRSASKKVPGGSLSATAAGRNFPPKTRTT